MDLEYTPVKPSSKTSVTATTTITAKAAENLSSFSLDFRKLKITSLKVNGTQAANYQQINIDGEDKQKLVVYPATAIASGAEFTVEVAYTTGTIDAFKRDGEANQGFFPSQNSRGASALGQPFGSTYWFPNNNSTTDRATYEIALTAPQDLTGVTIGVLASTKKRGDKITRTWVQDQGVVPYQTLASFGDYKEFVQPVELSDGTSISLRSYVDRTLYNSSTVNQTTIEKQIQSQPSIIGWGQDRFGVYPGVTGGAVYEELLNADLEPVAFGGVETNGRIFYSRIPGGNTFVHEYIHQWFGDAVTIGSYNDLWLSEGFATYFANVYYEDTAGLDLPARYRSWFADNIDPEFWQTAPGALASESDLFSNAVYGRGGYVLAALRASIGDDAFDDVVTRWYTSKKGSSGTTQDFVDVAEQVTGLDLDGVFSTWLYGAGRPAAFPTKQLPTTAPKAPAKPVVTVSGSDATVTWSAPDGAEDAQLTGYTVTLSNGATAPADADEVSRVFTDLADGTYTAKVVASNAAGATASPDSDSFQVSTVDPGTGPAATSLTVGKVGSAAYGKKVTVPVTVSSPGATGRVTLTVAGKPVGSGQVAAGRVSLTVDTTKLKVGANTVTVAYSGDAGHAGSTTQVRVDVAKAVSKVTAKLSRKTITRSQRSVVTIKATASGVKATGRVKVTVGGKSTTVTLKNGTAKVRIGTFAKAGTKKITIRYLGSAQVKAGQDHPEGQGGQEVDPS
ncbi:M1 family aminopeptidase [Aeromicrobium sp. UC242_57]|uniref:M1 family aminopeptidase n=1 Tax=Aeromicrobium sp. UC242_57 TaxID=3374624 RepID=UPI0037ACAFA8